MDPITATLYLVASAIWQSIDGNKLAGDAFTGILGNRADWLFGRVREHLVSRLANGQIVNHDIQRAVREAYLNASLLACRACLQPLEKSNWLFGGNDRYFSEEAKSLRLINRYLDGELEKFRDPAYAPTTALAAPAQLELLLVPGTPTVSGQVHDLARYLKDQLLTELAAQFESASELAIPDSFRESILAGWQEGNEPQDWFEWLCGFFHEYLKTRPRLSEILEKQWLAELKIGNEAVTVLAADVEQSLASMSGHVVELIALIKKLDGKTDEILEYSKLIPVILDLLRAKPATPARAKYLNTFAHYDLANLIGREQQLADIEQRLSQHKLLLLRGIGGIGKTTLARAYLTRSRDAYDHLAYVEMVGSLADSMLNQLGNSPDVAFVADPKQTTEEKFSALIDTLRHIPNLLLVIDDNVNDPKDLVARKAALESLNATVLMTSRLRLSEYRLVSMEIGALRPEEARQLFERFLERACPDNEGTIVDDLLEKAFYHAKLIEVIATQLRRNPFLTLTKAKTLVEQGQYDNEELNYPDETDAQTRTIYRILLGLFNADPLADELKQLLRYFAVLPTIDIPVTHLADMLGIDTPDDRRTLSTNLRKLTQTAWLDNLDGTYFSMHGLVQWVIREQLQPTVQSCSDLIEGITNLLRRLYADNPLSTQPYINYADELVRHLNEDENGPLTTLYGDIAVIYGVLGDNEKRLAYNLKALSIREQTLSATHPSLALSYANIAATYGALGDNEQALAYDLKALSIREQTLSATHPDLALSYANIAVTYGALGDNEQALAYNLKALSIREQTLSVTHPSLAQSYANIAATYGALGDNQQALAYDLKALSIREQTLSATHPDLAQSYANIAATYGALGDNEKRLAYNLKALSIREQTLSATHPSLAQSYANIAVTYGALGDNEQALAYDLKALSIREQTLSATHPDLALSYNNIAATYGALGDNEQALAYNLKALSIREQTLSATHPDLAQSYANIAATYGALGDNEKRLAYNLKALSIREQTLSATHPDLALSYNNIAATYGALGDQEKRLAYDLKALSIREQTLSATHPSLALSYANIAATYGALGDNEQALAYDLKALSIREQTLSATHPDLALSYANIAVTYGALGDNEKRLAYNLKALSIREQTLSATHPSLALSYANIAITYYYRHALDKALFYMKKAVAIREQILPANHPDRISSRESLAAIEQAIDDQNENPG